METKRHKPAGAVIPTEANKLRQEGKLLETDKLAEAEEHRKKDKQKQKADMHRQTI